MGAEKSLLIAREKKYYLITEMGHLIHKNKTKMLWWLTHEKQLEKIQENIFYTLDREWFLKQEIPNKNNLWNKNNFIYSTLLKLNLT